MKALRALLLVAGSLLPASRAAAQAAWVVDPAGGPGSDFTDLQVAIDAAGEGDILVLRSGDQKSSTVVFGICIGCLTIDAKSLTLVAEAGATVSVRELTVRNLGPSQSVALRGFSMDSNQLVLENDLGTVWLEDLSLSWTSPTFIPLGTPLKVSNSSMVHVNRSLVRGADTGGHSSFSGSDAMIVGNSSVHLYDTTAVGGLGAAGFGGPPGYGVGFGGSGLFFASGSTFGGSGLNLVSGPAYTLDSSGPVQIGTATHTDLAGTARHLQASSPVRVGQTATIEIDGLPGDIPILDFATRPGAFFQTFYKGTYQLGTLPLVSLVLGPLPASGELDLAFTVNPFGPSFQGVTLYVQADFFSLPGELTMGPGSAMTILAP